MFEKRDVIDGNLVHEIATEVAKKIFSKNKDKIVEEINANINTKIERFLIDKLESNLLLSEAKISEIEKEYYYSKGKGCLTPEAEQQYKKELEDIEKNKEDIRRIKNLISL